MSCYALGRLGVRIMDCLVGLEVKGFDWIIGFIQRFVQSFELGFHNVSLFVSYKILRSILNEIKS